MDRLSFEPLTIEEAAAHCRVDRSVIDSLVKESAINGFPAARLSKRVVRIDKYALQNWLSNGGLNGKYQTDLGS